MQDDISTTSGGRTERQSGKGKKSSNANAKWSKESAVDSFENESGSIVDAASDAISDAGSNAGGLSKSMGVDNVIGSARTAYDSVVSRGSELMSKVDLSRGTTVIRDYPIQAAVGGLIVGFLLGAAIYRRSPSFED